MIELGLLVFTQLLFCLKKFVPLLVGFRYLSATNKEYTFLKS